MGKRITAVFFSALLALSLCACGKSEEKSVYVPDKPAEAFESGIDIEKIETLPEDFVFGMDLSSLLAQERSGVVYRDKAGNARDLMEILADAGIDAIRVRVWNDPFTSDGHGYGGGNCTAQTAAELGRRAAEHSMKTVVDFHYSDFWADPSKQMCPKAWRDLSLDDKAQALYDYTRESLEQILDAGADVSMVQVGNEINYGICGEDASYNIYKLLASGGKAVRDVSNERGLDIKIVLHFTNVQYMIDTLMKAAAPMEHGVEYDVVGLSYYPYWNGELDNLKELIERIIKKTGREVMIMETSYPYTASDGDGSGNSVSHVDCPWPVSVQGQAEAVRAVTQAAAEAGAKGLFYWEGAWTPVGQNKTQNSLLWEEYGSGWASSFAAEYDSEDAGRFYGGSSWDNQALFDFDSVALDSIDVFNAMRVGTK